MPSLNIPRLVVALSAACVVIKSFFKNGIKPGNKYFILQHTRMTAVKSIYPLCFCLKFKWNLTFQRDYSIIPTARNDMALFLS